MKIFVCTIRRCRDVQILWACERAGLGELVSAKGLDYMLSDDLRSLSGGEKQRILLARMLLHERSFYIVDELTTGLDHATAGRVACFFLRALVRVCLHYAPYGSRGFGGGR